MTHTHRQPLLVVICCALASLALAWTGEVHPTIMPNRGTIEVNLYKHGIFRVRTRPSVWRYEVEDVVVAQPLADSEGFDVIDSETHWEFRVKSGLDSVIEKVQLRVHKESLKAQLFTDDVNILEYTIPIQDDTENVDANWKFLRANNLFGIPEHAVDLALEPSKEYRLWNLDVFEYKLDVPDALYGSIPFLMAHSAVHTAGTLFLNSGDTKVSFTRPTTEVLDVSWRSQGGGIHDIFLFIGPTPKDVHQQHAFITGKPFLPPLFSLGYHQCRWNYRSSDDVRGVDNGFDDHNIPYDVLWLDIEHTDSKKYFTWDYHNFPEPEKLIDELSASGRKMVTIVDPHTKRHPGYYLYEEAVANNHFVKTEGGSDFEGDCWPGRSSWPDFYNPEVRKWYASQFALDKYKHSTKDLWLWIDMNEPSVFNAHEVTMDRNAIHQRNGKTVKHKDVHNMYGFYNGMAVHEGLVARSNGRDRPFILSRSFYAGSQRYVSVWTGDNMAKWEHLHKSFPMVLSMSIANLPFIGADVGGFFYNPEPELFARWIEAGAFYPFFRGHAHLETKRREPWLFGEPYTSAIRAAIARRYIILPYLYTAFFEAHVEGLPVIRPIFYEFPTWSDTETEGTAFFFGEALIVQPITSAGVADARIPTPNPDQKERWYNFWTGLPAPLSVARWSQPAPLGTIPVVIRGGHIVTTRQRLRRSAAAMKNDPYTLTVALDAGNRASGRLFLDDEHTFGYDEGAYLLRQFTFEANVLSCSRSHATSPYRTIIPESGSFSVSTKVERVVVYGLPAGLKAVFAQHAAATPHLDAGQVFLVRQQVEFTVDSSTQAVTLRKPDLFVAADWTIVFEF